MDNRMLLHLLQNPELIDDDQLSEIIKSLKKTLGTCHDMKALNEEMQKCKSQYSELLKLAGELNDIFEGEQ